MVKKTQTVIVTTCIFAAVGVLGVTITDKMFSIQPHQRPNSRVEVQQDRITLAQDNNSNLKTFSRQTNSEIFYRVTLKNAPLGKKLALVCDWINAHGEIVVQSRYQTPEINQSIWNTDCRYKLNYTTATRGNWMVQMFLDGNLISHEEFEVK